MVVKDHAAAALLSESYDKPLRDALDQIARLDELARSLEAALEDARAVAAYVRHYRELTDSLLQVAAQVESDLIVVGDDRVTVFDVKVGTGGFLRAALEESAASAPFSRWSASLGLREGVAVHALASLRDLLPNAKPLLPPTGSVRALAISQLEAVRFLRAVRRSLNADEPPLEHVQQVFGLNFTELGALFGVSRQGVKDWLERGVPSERQDKLATVGALADLLERKLKSDRIPGIARRPADAYGGQTMLELIAADRHRELLDLTHESFDWATAA
jgi:hypothetical protein